MPITRVGVGAQAASQTSGGSLTAAYPAAYSAVADDFAVVIIGGRPTGTIEPGVPTGYAKRNTRLREVGANDLRVSLYYKKLVGGEAAPVFTVPASWSGTSAGMSAQMAVYRGVDTSNPFDVADALSDAGSQKTFAPTGLTPVTAGAWVLSLVATSDDNALALVAGSEQGFAVAMGGANYDTATGGDHAIGLADKEINPAAAVTCPTWDQTVASTDFWSAVTVALRPAPTTTFITIPTGDLTLEGFAPRIAKILLVPTGDLVLTGFAPSLPKIVSPGAGALTLEGFAPLIAKILGIPAGSLVLEGFAPTIPLPTIIEVPTGELILEGFAPSIATIIEVPTGLLVLEGFAPILPFPTIIEVPTGLLVLAGFAPTIFVDAPPPPPPPEPPPPVPFTPDPVVARVWVAGAWRTKIL